MADKEKMAEEEKEETELDELTKLRDDYEKNEHDGISVTWDEGKEEFIIKLYDDDNKKTSYLIFDRKNLTDEQRLGLRTIAGMTDNVLWVSGESDENVPMVQ